MPGGQPTKYREKYCSDKFIAEYVEDCKEERRLISLCGYAVYIGVCEDTLQEWRKANAKFSVPLERIKQLGKESLINKGLDKSWSGNMARFCLSANHGMAERTVQDHNVSEETAKLLGLIDGSSTGKLPTGEEVKDAG